MSKRLLNNQVDFKKIWSAKMKNTSTPIQTSMEQRKHRCFSADSDKEMKLNNEKV